MDFTSLIAVVFVRKKMVRDSRRLLRADKMVHYLILYYMNSKRLFDCAGEQRTRASHLCLSFMKPSTAILHVQNHPTLLETLSALVFRPRLLATITSSWNIVLFAELLLSLPQSVVSHLFLVHGILLLYNNQASCNWASHLLAEILHGIVVLRHFCLWVIAGKLPPPPSWLHAVAVSVAALVAVHLEPPAG